MTQNSYFKGFIKILRGCIAFYLLYWAVEHFFSPQYFEELHKKLYLKFLHPALTYMLMEPPQIQLFDGYWLRISQVLGSFQILTAFLYWKYQKIGSILTCFWGFIGFIISHFQIIKKSLQLLNSIGFDTVNIPVFAFVLIILFSSYIQKLYTFLATTIQNCFIFILRTFKLMPREPEMQESQQKFIDKFVQTQQSMMNSH